MDVKHFGQRTEMEEQLGYDFHNKALPTLFAGSLLWMTSTLFFSGTITGKPFIPNTGTLILLFIGYFGLAIATMIKAARRENETSRVLFMVLSLILGMISGLTVEWGVLVLGSVELARGLFVGSTFVAATAIGAAAFIGKRYKDQIKGNWIVIFTIFGFTLFFQQIILILLFGFSTALLLITIFELMWIFGITIYDCATMHENIKAGFWMLSVINIFLDLVIITLRVFILLVYMFADN
jgi:hypothetical protein